MSVAITAPTLSACLGGRTTQCQLHRQLSGRRTVPSSPTQRASVRIISRTGETPPGALCARTTRGAPPAGATKRTATARSSTRSGARRGQAARSSATRPGAVGRRAQRTGDEPSVVVAAARPLIVRRDLRPAALRPVTDEVHAGARAQLESPGGSDPAQPSGLRFWTATPSPATGRLLRWTKKRSPPPRVSCNSAMWQSGG